jgi:type I restriction enzyme, S subunit
MSNRYARLISGLPTDWPVLPLSRAAERIVSGGTPSRAVPAYWDGQIPWVTPGELTNLGMKYLNETREAISLQGLAASGATLLPRDSLMVTTRATLGSVALAARPTATNQGFKSVVFGQSGEPSFYFHYFRMLLPELIRRSSGTTFLEISAKQFGQIAIPVPPIAEQRRIAEILDTADEAIRSTERLIVKLEQARHGLLRDLLTRGAEVTGCLHDLSDGDLQPSSLGLIPPDWRVTALGDLGAQGVPVLRTGPFGSSLKGEDWVGSGVPVITIGSLGEGILDYGELLFISENKAAILAAYRVRAGEIVFSRVADVGRSVVVRHEHNGWVMSSNLMKITLDSNRAAPDYVQLVLAYDPRVRKQLRSIVNSSGRDVVSGSIVKALLIPLPPIEEQRRICARVSQSRASIEVEADLLAKLHLLKQGLMDDLLTGRVRVGASA